MSYASEIAYLILSRELRLSFMSYLRGECALHNFLMNPLSESLGDYSSTLLDPERQLMKNKLN